MTEKDSKVSLSPFQHRRQPTKYWKDGKEMHRAMHNLPGTFRAVLLELIDRPMTRHEIRDMLNRMGRNERHNRRITNTQLKLEDHLRQAQELKVLKERNGKYYLTRAGREMAEHMHAVIPAFMKWVFSPETTSFLSIWVHVLLSILKLGIGFISRSAGLIADGIDNTMDTLSSLLVWLGIKYDKEKLASIFILITMFISVGGVAVTTVNKIAHPGPVRGGLMAFAISGLCGLIMLGLSSYQYVVGKKRSNIAILCQAVDSRNHFWTSLLVCGGIILSFFVDVLHAPWLHYADSVASAIIGLLILRGALELSKELFKKDQKETDVSHFMKAAQERHRETIILRWLSNQLHSTSLGRQELEERFAADFCEKQPKIFTLTEIGYRPRSGTELRPYLDLFVKRKKLLLDDGQYWLIAGSSS
jgi:Co/Zn/Cd efflux system component